MEKAKCAVCGIDDCEILFKGRDYRCCLSKEQFAVARCRKCGLIYLNPRPTKKELGKYYPTDYYNSGSSFFGNKINNFLVRFDARSLEKYKKRGRLLDLGCGAGDFLLEMKKKGFETFGVDISKNACEIARKKGLTVFPGELTDQNFPDNYFDVVTLWHVFEHLDNPQSVLKEISRILKKEGILLIEVPNINSFGFNLFGKYYFHLDLPRHLYLWSPSTLQKVLRGNGFKILRRESFSLGFPFSLFHSFYNYFSDYTSRQPKYNFLRDSKIKGFSQKISLIVVSPFLLIMTIFSRILSPNGEIVRVYASRN